MAPFTNSLRCAPEAAFWGLFLLQNLKKSGRSPFLFYSSYGSGINYIYFSTNYGSIGDKWGRIYALTGDEMSRLNASMGKTLEVAADRAFDQSKTIIPAELARGVYMRNAPSLQALKLMHLMIARVRTRSRFMESTAKCGAVEFWD